MFWWIVGIIAAIILFGLGFVLEVFFWAALVVFVIWAFSLVFEKRETLKTTFKREKKDE